MTDRILSPSQIEQLRQAYDGLTEITEAEMVRVHSVLDRFGDETLRQLAQADIPLLSSSAEANLRRRGN